MVPAPWVYENELGVGRSYTFPDKVHPTDLCGIS